MLTQESQKCAFACVRKVFAQIPFRNFSTYHSEHVDLACVHEVFAQIPFLFPYLFEDVPKCSLPSAVRTGYVPVRIGYVLA